MDRRYFLASAAALACAPGRVFAQGQAKVARIGWLTAQRESSVTPYLEAMRAGFADLGYVEGRNLTIEYRYGDDEVARVAALADELIKLPVDLIVVQGEVYPGLENWGFPCLSSMSSALIRFRPASPTASHTPAET